MNSAYQNGNFGWLGSKGNITSLSWGFPLKHTILSAIDKEKELI